MATTRKKHLINVHTSTGTTAPTGASLYLGEIAVQHTPNEPALWVKVGTAESSTDYEKFIGETEINNEFRKTNHNIPYVVQSGNIYTGTTYEYVAEAPEITELVDGQSIIFHPKQCSFSGTTNGSAITCSLSLQLADGTTTTPRPIYLKATAKLTNHLSGCTDVKLTYHDNATYSATTGLCGWWLDFYYDTNSNTLPTQLYGFPMRANNAIPRYTLAMQNSAGTWDSIVLNSATTQTTSARTDVGFVLNSPIIYYSATGLTAGKNSSTASTYIAINSFDFRYSSNCTTSAGTAPITSGYPIYLVGTVHEDGLFYLDDTTWWTQTLPSSEDGKVYIYLGQGVSWNSATAALLPDHPVYEYKNGHVRLYQEGEGIEMILGSGYTYSGIPYINSSTTIADAFSALTKGVIDDEYVVSNALNDLNSRVTEIEEGGNLGELSASVVTNAENIETLSAITEQNEYIVACALNDLNTRVGELSGAAPDLSIVYELSASVLTLSGKVCNSEMVIAAAFNDVNSRLVSYSGMAYNLSNSLTGLSAATTGVSGLVATLSGSVDSLKSAMVTAVTSASTHSEYPTAKAVYDEVHPAIITTGGTAATITVEPNVLYNFGTLTGPKTFALAAPGDSSVVNHYYWTFDTSTTAPNITWPSGLTWYGGSAPVLSPNLHYEISVLNSIAVFMEV